MYVLIPKTKLRNAGRVKFHNSMPDGRAIVHISELKAIGSVMGVDILTTKRAVDELIHYQKEHGIFPEEPQPNPEVPEGEGSGDTPTVLPEPGEDLLPPDEGSDPSGSADTEGTGGTAETDKEQPAEQPECEAGKGGEA